MFYELYFLRWPIECKYLELKQTLKIEEFSGATAVSIQQEFFINFLLSNLAALMKTDADKAIEKSCRPTNKHRYKANRSFLLGRIKNVLPKMVFGLLDISYLDILLEEARHDKVQIQPGRHDPRPQKSNARERKHHNNRKTAV